MAKSPEAKRLHDWWAELDAARADALRESFRAGGEMLDLKQASDELSSTMVELEQAVWRTGSRA